MPMSFDKLYKIVCLVLLSAPVPPAAEHPNNLMLPLTSSQSNKGQNLTSGRKLICQKQSGFLSFSSLSSISVHVGATLPVDNDTLWPASSSRFTKTLSFVFEKIFSIFYTKTLHISGKQNLTCSWTEWWSVGKPPHLFNNKPD